MKVKYIKTKGFRKFKDIFETDLYDITNITGKNRSGKSNILYAIVNIMLGTNLSGNEKDCLINKDCDDSYGEMRFVDNQGREHTLIRVRNKYSNKGNVLVLDEKPCKQEDLISFYKDKKLFLSIINPLYFLNKSPAEQKEMVDKYLSDIKTKVIFDRLTTEEQNKLVNKYYNHKSKDYKELSSEEQEEFINLNMLNICMDIAYNNLSKSEQNVLEGVPKDIPTYISELNDEIKKAENTITSLDGKLEYAQNIANEEVPEYKYFEKEEELLLARQELSFLSTNKEIVDKENQMKVVEKLEKEVLSKETECKELEKSMKEGKIKYLAIKNGKSCTCPTCEQKIENESKNITIQNMKNELVAFYNKKNLLDASLSDLKVKLGIERCKYHALDGDITASKSKRIEVVQENISQLEIEKADIESYNNEISIKEKNINIAKNDIEKFLKEKQNCKKYINSLNKAKKVAQKLYIAYIEEKMKLAKDYLKHVNIKFYTVLKTTGEIKDDFIITYQNRPLVDLSRSELTATALEFANMFNKISRGSFPIFIDDYESCTDYNFAEEYSKETQVLVSKVEKGSPLKIADSTGEQFTIIKPVIKGFKTIKIQNNNAVHILQAA